MNKAKFWFSPQEGQDVVEHKNDDMPRNVDLIVYKVYTKEVSLLMKFDFSWSVKKLRSLTMIHGRRSEVERRGPSKA